MMIWRACNRPATGVATSSVPMCSRCFGERGSRADVTPCETTHHLGWLAHALTDHGQAVFLLEQLQPDWLRASGQRWLYAILSRTALGLVMSMIFLVGFAQLALRHMDGGVIAASLLMGLIVGAAVGVFTAVGFERQGRAGPGVNVSQPHGWRLLAWLAALGLFTFAVAVLLFQAFGATFEQASSAGYGNALAFVLFFGLDSRRVSGLHDVHPVETLTWSWPAGLRGSIPGAGAGRGRGPVGPVCHGQQRPIVGGGDFRSRRWADDRSDRRAARRRDSDPRGAEPGDAVVAAHKPAGGRHLRRGRRAGDGGCVPAGLRRGCAVQRRGRAASWDRSGRRGLAGLRRHLR